MITSKQKPSTAPFGRDPHDFSQTNSDWEAAVFDSATRFNAIDYGVGGGARPVTPYQTMEEAVAAVSSNPRVCLYAITEEGIYGRSVLLDRVMWPEWISREKKLKKEIAHHIGRKLIRARDRGE
jgi:hypothetical protein